VALAVEPVAHPAIAEQLGVAVVVLAGLTLLATLWRRWFARGPIETVLRRISA
jgi:uncharacterized membrane protein YeiB